MQQENNFINDFEESKNQSFNLYNKVLNSFKAWTLNEDSNIQLQIQAPTLYDNSNPLRIQPSQFSSIP